MKASNNSVILLTGTIAPNIFNDENCQINVALTSAEERLKQYEETISLYITDSFFENIVFVENSGFPFDERKYVILADSYNKKFEFLYMNLTNKQIQNMKARGKSYGESLLIDYAINNSNIISRAEEVYKVTGRVFVANSRRILEKRRIGLTEAICNNAPKFTKTNMLWTNWIHTEFIKFTKTDYFNYWNENWDDCDDFIKPKGKKDCIEKVWYRMAKEKNATITNFLVFPDLRGMRGGDLKAYNHSGIDIFVRSILCKFGYYSLR